MLHAPLLYLAHNILTMAPRWTRQELDLSRQGRSEARCPISGGGYGKPRPYKQCILEMTILGLIFEIISEHPGIAWNHLGFKSVHFECDLGIFLTKKPKFGRKTIL